MERHYQRIMKDTENRVLKSMRIQELDCNNPNYGGFYDAKGVIHAKFSIYRVASMIAVYCNEDSKYHQNEKVFQSISLGLDYIHHVQHENGLFDYVTCNFYSAPDTAFCIKKLLPVLSYLKQKERTMEEETLYEKIACIVKSGAYGLLNGGFHTPNHRWAIASVLMMCWKLFDEKKFKVTSESYLNEGIDCNEDGEFAEKSAGNYNRINNDAMLMLSEVTKDSTYETYAIKNLKMMLTYIEPDGSIFTANSTRFDKDHLIYPKDYYVEYLSMGMKYQIPEFIEMANEIFELIEKKNITSPDFLILFMLHPEYREFEYDETSKGSEEGCNNNLLQQQASCIQKNYHVFYKDSGIVRCKSDFFTYTVMNGKTNFFYLHNKTMKLELKLSGSFCEHRGFKSEAIEQLEDGSLHLHQTMRGWYYLPFEEKPETSDWWKMDHASRKKKLGPDMDLDVWVCETADGVKLRIKTSGVEGAPFRVELAFMGAKTITNEYFDMPVAGGEVLVAKAGEVRVTNETDTLIVGPAFGMHHFTDGKEDSEAKVAGAVTICFTDYTSFDRTIQIRNEKSSVVRELS